MENEFYKTFVEFKNKISTMPASSLLDYMDECLTTLTPLLPTFSTEELHQALEVIDFMEAEMLSRIPKTFH